MLRNRKRSLGAVFAVGAAVAVLASGAGANATVARPLSSSAALPQITITMNGKKITVSGALQSGGVRIVSRVTQEPLGDPTLVRLDPGVTVAQVLKAAAGDPNNIALIASVVFSPQANKGVSVAQVNLKPGQYVAVDLATRAKTPPLTTFTITKAAAPASLPRPQATMSAIEFGFRGPASLRDGELVRFANHGFLVHMMVGIRGRSAAGAQQIARLLRAGQDRQAQRLATGSYAFYGILTHGQSQQQVVRNRPGFWVLACFMDTQDGREHTQLGMERVIRIVR
jgi:hypothetical protein